MFYTVQHLLLLSAELYMPTKKRRLGFIPNSNVLALIMQLSSESNLSCAKVINILVEEALYNRGMINITSSAIFRDNNNNILEESSEKNLKLVNNEFTNNYKNLLNKEKIHFKNVNEEPFDNEIYTKFLMFLKFQEKMKNTNLE